MTSNARNDVERVNHRRKKTRRRVRCWPDNAQGENVPEGAAARGRRACARVEVEGVDATRAATLAAAAVEKNALVFFALFSALRERRCTPREVSMLDDVDDDEVGGSRAS